MTANNPKITLYCDVDGVLNITSRRAKDLVSRRILRQLPSFGQRFTPVPLRIRWRETIVNQLSTLPVSFVWLTTWNYQAVRILEPLMGIRSEHVLEYDMTWKEFRTHPNKYNLLRLHQSLNPTPFIWIDDIATQHYHADHWKDPSQHLVIRPEKKFGITNEHMASISEFTKNYSSLT